MASGPFELHVIVPLRTKALLCLAMLSVRFALLTGMPVEREACGRLAAWCIKTGGIRVEKRRAR